MERIIERTEDGSATLFVPELNEHYHSTKGARTESQHIFIDMGLKASTSVSPRILEIGFGTGLNAWLTLEEAERSGRNVYYTGLELYPLEWQMIEQLGYISDNEQLTIDGESKPAIELFRQLHTSPWEEEVRLSPHFTLRKVEADVNHWTIENNKWIINKPEKNIDPSKEVVDHPNDSTDYSKPVVDHQNHATEHSKHIIAQSQFDVIYFDAFAPEKQPEMWSQELFDRLYVLLGDDGILTTYCAKGIVRRMLQSAGFIVERLPGPPGGKREILRARKQA